MSYNREILVNQLSQIDNNIRLLLEIRNRFYNRFNIIDTQLQLGNVELASYTTHPSSPEFNASVPSGTPPLLQTPPPLIINPILGSLHRDMLFQVSMNLIQEFDNEHINETVVIPLSTEVNPPIQDYPVYIIPRERLKTKTKTLSREECEYILPDVCGICLDNHSKIETVDCSCNHNFGKECFKSWKKICNSNKKDLSCPTCRQTIIHITKFRIKPQSRQLNVSNPAIPSPVSIPPIPSHSGPLNVIEYY